MTVPLIEPKHITIHSDLHDKDVDFQIGYYPTVGGTKLVMESVETIKAILSNDSGKFSESSVNVMMKMSNYADVKGPDGEWRRLETENMINSHVPDYEVWCKLALKIHDYNSFFLNTEKLSKTSRSFMGQVKGQATKILKAWSDSSSQKS